MSERESLILLRYREALEKIATPLSEPQWCPCGGRFIDRSDEVGIRCDTCHRYLSGGERTRIARKALDA